MGAERLRRAARRTTPARAAAASAALRSAAPLAMTAASGHDFAHIRVLRQPAKKKKAPAKKKAKKSTKLTEAQVRSYVTSNNKSTVSTDLLVCLIWKESGFDPKDKSKSSTATGLMQMTKGAVKQVNKSSPKGVHFKYSEMTDPAKNVDCGTRYLQIRIDWAKASTTDGLNGFGTGTGYADDILACETCLAAKPATSTPCLTAIHP